MKFSKKMIQNVSKIIIEQTFDIGVKFVNEYIIGKECICSSFDKIGEEWKLNYSNKTPNFTIGSIESHIENVINFGVPYKISVIGK